MCIAGFLAGYVFTQDAYVSALSCLIAASIAVMYVCVLRLFGQLTPVRKTLALHCLIDSFHPVMRGNILRYAEETGDGLYNMIRDLKRGKVLLDDSQYERFLRIAFGTKITYYAIDVSLPSEYHIKYPAYLQAHERSLSNRRGYRIIAREPDEIKRDSKEPEFSKFWEWHDDHGVGLYQISRRRLDEIIKNHGADPAHCTLGIAMWGAKIAILFAGAPGGKLLRVIPSSDEQFADIRRIYEQVRTESVVMQRAGSPRIMKRPIIDGWRDYIQLEKRWRIMRPFLYLFFDRYKVEKKLVIDVAAGMGLEYFHMMEDGYLMHANEVQEELVSVGIKYGTDCGYSVRYSPTRHTWLDLTKMGLAGMYGGLFATGNSIRMVGGRDEQRKIISQFYELLQEGGTIVIDERNHGRLLRHAGIINRVGMERKNSRIFAEVSEIMYAVENPLYHGSAIHAIPYAIDHTSVTFCYYAESARTLAGAEQSRIQDWLFYHYDPLGDLLSDAGFVNVRKFADYDPGRKLGVNEDADDAAMFVYVATKP